MFLFTVEYGNCLCFRDLLWTLAIPFEILHLISGVISQKSKSRRRKAFWLAFLCTFLLSSVVGVLPVILGSDISRSAWGICTFNDRRSVFLWNAASWLILLCSVFAYAYLWFKGFPTFLLNMCIV